MFGFSSPNRTLVFMIFLISMPVSFALTGCSNGSQRSHDPDVVVLSFKGEKKSNAELRDLRRRARDGDGQAAYQLFAYYGLGRGENARLAERFFEIAVELEWPPALYAKAVRIWDWENDPDLNQVFDLASRAIELGYKHEGVVRGPEYPDEGVSLGNERDFLERVKQALEAGEIPPR